MPTTLLQLPLEIRLRVYHYALLNATITLELELHRRYDLPGYDWIIPDPKLIKQQFIGQRHNISLLYASK